MTQTTSYKTFILSNINILDQISLIQYQLHQLKQSYKIKPNLETKQTIISLIKQHTHLQSTLQH